MGMSPSIATFPLSSLYLFFREARILFKAGKNRDGYFGAEELLVQVDFAIDIFEGLSKGNFRGLFLFDNAPSHQKRAPDAISAQKMPKGAPLSTFLCYLIRLPLMQGRRVAGRIIQVGHACDLVSC